MSTPVCIANAVADAFGVAEIRLPLTPDHMPELLKQGSSDPTQSFQALTLVPALCATSGSLRISEMPSGIGLLAKE